jgi:phosphoribosylformylglycinamidine synthase PurS subunit
MKAAGTNSQGAESWIVDVLVMPKEGVNDPEGESIKGGLVSLGYEGIRRVRAGKHYRLFLDAANEVSAARQAQEMSDRLLANPVIQFFSIESVSRDVSATVST